MYDFSGKVIVITGAAQGLGYSIAERFLKESANKVVMIDLKEEALYQAQKALDPDGKFTLALPCDVSDGQAVAETFKKIEETYSQVDILINNAGITRDAMAHKMSGAQFDAVLKVSLYGAFNCCQQVLNGMRERKYGKIISLSSMGGINGNIGQANYSAAKAGVIGLTKTLALENGSKGINVNAIAPGMINTDIIKTVPDKVQDLLKSKIPMGRFGEPSEIANLALFLASDESSYISGQCICITGGY